MIMRLLIIMSLLGLGTYMRSKSNLYSSLQVYKGHVELRRFPAGFTSLESGYSDPERSRTRSCMAHSSGRGLLWTDI
jgi:hypothetical protein